MIPRTAGDTDVLSRHTVALTALFVVFGALLLAGCGVVSGAKAVARKVEGNRSAIDAFTGRLQSGEATTFEATYVTTGSSPATVVYAVEPPRGLAFSETPSASNGNFEGVHIVVNSSGEYSCSPTTSLGTAPTPDTSCEKLGPADAANQNKIFDFYTPSHWIEFLRDFSLAAGIAGDSVTSSTMTVNGFNMQCVDFHASGVPGTSTICSTAQGILGFVKVASNTTSFEIQNYSSSPPASLFELPPGATITTAQ